MNRRDFLRRSALIAAGAVAADQLDLLDRLGWVRSLFPGWSASSPLWDTSVSAGGPLTMRMIDECFRQVYEQNRYSILPVMTPLRGRSPLRLIADLNAAPMRWYGVAGA